MTKIPDINLMREVAEEKTAVFNEEFAKSEVFAKMCSDIQNEANKGNFSKTFDINSHGGSKAILAARDLFLKGGYQAYVSNWSLVVDWGRYTVAEENE